MTYCRELSYIGQCQLIYWQNFINYVKGKHPEAVFNYNAAIPRHWCILNIGSSHGWLSAEVNSRTKEISVRFTLKSNEDAKEIFDKLYVLGYKKSIEDVSPNIEWRRLNNRKTSVVILLERGDFTDKSDWREIRLTPAG